MPADTRGEEGQTDDVTLAQIVAALSVTYTPVGVLIWLTGERRSGPSMTELLDNEGPRAVAEHVRRLGVADPSAFTVAEVGARRG